MSDTIIIVLGNRNRKIMEARVNTAIDYFNSTTKEEHTDFGVFKNNNYLLFSGGSCDGVSKPEGAVMMNEYAKGKVPEDRCMIELDSKTTFENLIFSKKLIETHFKCNKTYQFPNIIICTSTFHIKRSALMAKLIFQGYPMNFIDTSEEITKEQMISEANNIVSFVNNYFPFNF